ncbi:DUF2513 domain-containing protein [Clostridium thermobutyricum]|uniref:DUF2513 domain-containing protein n=1 Tax=Clostridium thermobutyricum TaxID=29372 RepID=UPI0029425B45|nr:DUF2513 domain-containing protein [Clostridium thermobutyricum]
MKLNPNCIRDILLSTESLITGLNSYISYTNPSSLNLTEYTNDVILYHIKQCELSNLLIIDNWYLNGGCLIRDLTPIGHEFLANIREDSNWNKTKEIANKVGSFSLKTLTTIASNVVASIVKSTLHI